MSDARMNAGGDIRSRRLARVSTDTGRFSVLAIDHVRSFAATVRPDDPDLLSFEDIRAAKLRLVEGLAPHAGGILVDPGFLTGLDMAQRAALAGTGLILGIEDGDYEDVRTSPRLLPGWNVQRAAALDVDAVKIAVYFDPDRNAGVAQRFVADVVEECREAGMPLFCEPLALYRRPEDRTRAVLEGVKLFGHLGADVMKLQFPHAAGSGPGGPAWVESCAEIDRICPIPWTILSEGSDYGLFREQLRVACRAGASGFLAGRAVWREAATGASDLGSGADRLDELGEIALSCGVSWPVRSGRRITPR